MPIHINCPSCQKPYQLKDELAGKKTRCQCGAVITIPLEISQPAAVVEQPAVPAANAGPLGISSTAAVQGNPLSTVDPLGLPSSQPLPAAVSQLAGSQPHQPRASYAQTETRGIPAWILPIVALLLAAILIGGGYMLMRGGGDKVADAPDDKSPGVVIEQPSSGTSTGGEIPADTTGSALPDDTSAGMTPAAETITNSIEMKFVKVEPQGARMMGTKEPTLDATADEKPPHPVNFNLSLLFGVHEVTQAQFQQVMESNPSHFRGDDRPVDSVSWDQAREFCQRLSDLTAERRAGRAYRLPSEAEWEYFARGGEKTAYHFGDDPAQLSTRAWHQENSQGSSQAVGKKTPNPLGLHDMLGNVWEWCSDWYHDEYYQFSPGDSPRGPRSGTVRVLRGGSWANGSIACRDGFRFFGHPAVSNSRIGFRVVCIPSAGNSAPAASLSQIASSTLAIGSPEDLARTTMDIFAEGRGETFDLLVPNPVDLTRLPTSVFDEYPCRAVAIKESLVHYRRIPSNLRFVMGISRNEAAKRYGVSWAATQVDEILARAIEGTTGLPHCHSIRINFSSSNNSELGYSLFLNGAANFNGRWKITNRISHDALRPVYPEPLPTSELIVKDTGFSTTPVATFTDDGLGVHTYDPLYILQLALPAKQVHSRGLAYNINAGLIAYAYDVRTSDDGNPAIAQDGRITVWNTVSGAVVLDDTWTHEEITATRPDLVGSDFAGQQMRIQFTSDSTRVALGRDRVVFWDLAQGKKVEGSNPPGLAWKLSESGEAVADQSAAPKQEVIVQSPSGKFHLAATRKTDQRGRIFTELRLLGSSNEEVKKLVLPGEIPRLVFTLDDRPLVMHKQFILDVSSEHTLAEKFRWNHEKQFGEFMIEDTSGNQQRIVTRYGRTFNRWLLRIWDVPSGREIFVPNEGLNRFDFSIDKRHSLSPDGRWLAVSDQNQVKFWQVFDPLEE